MAVAEEMLGALGHPLHRFTQPFGGDRGKRVFAIGKQFGAEAAADIGGDHAHLLRRQLHHLAGNDVADDVAALAAERERVALAVIFGDDAARIHVIGDQPLVDHAELDGAGGLREGGFGLAGVAGFDLEGDVAGLIGPDSRRFRRQCGGSADHMRQRLPIDRDRFGGVLRLRQRVGDHEGDGVADVAYLVARQDRIMRDLDSPRRGCTPGVGSGPSLAISLAVSTSRTPGIARTEERSPMLKRACACGERSITACSAPAGATSAT